MVTWLLDHDANVNICDAAGDTALHIIARHNYSFKCLRTALLSRQDINVHARNKVGQTPLDIACERRNVFETARMSGTLSGKKKSYNRSRLSSLDEFITLLRAKGATTNVVLA